MTSVNVFFGCPDPSHDVSLSDGTTTYGFAYAGGSAHQQEIPLSPPARQFDTKQKTFIGGRGTINIADDASGFYDSQNLWTTSEGMMFPSPQWRYGYRADADEVMPSDNVQLSWRKLYTATGFQRYADMPFVASNNTAMDKVYLFIRRVGTAAIGTLTVELCADNAGSPGTVLQTSTTAIGTINDLLSVYKVFDWSGTQARVSGTTYHVKVYGAATDDATTHWEVMVNPNSGAGLRSTDNATWSGFGGGIYFRVTGADTARKWHSFDLYGAKYRVSQNDDRTAPTLQINGFRGIVASATSTTFTVSQTCNRDFSGAYVRFIDGTGDGQIRRITSNTTGATPVFTVPTFDVTPDATSIFVIYGTQFWDDVTGTHGLTHVTGRPAVTDNIAYFPQGTSVFVRRMRVNGNNHDFAAEGTFKSDMLYLNTDGTTGTQIWGANAAASTVKNANVVAWGTNLTTITTTTIGSTAYRITNLYNYSGQFYVFKEDGLYKFDGTRAIRVGKNFSDNSDANNGVAVGDDNTYLWFSWGHSVERMLGSNVTDMLNWRAGYEGLPANQRGLVTQILPVIGWVFFVVDGGASNYSTVKVWNGFGWHEIFRGHKTGVRIRGVTWISCPGTNSQLWIDINGEMVYMEFPENAALPLRDSTLNFTHEGVYISPTLDAGSIETYKIIKSIRVFQSNTLVGADGQSSSQTIYVDYQRNANVDTPYWTNLGTANLAPFEEIIANLGETIQIRFRLRLYSTTTRLPAVCYGWAVSGREMPLSKYQFVNTFVVGTDRETNNDEPDFSADTLFTWLQNAAIAQTKLTMRTLNYSSDNKIVTVSLPVKSTDWVVESDWGGRISVVLMET